MAIIDLEIYRNKKVLITGHTGFKGSWLALWLLEIGAEVAGYSLPPESLSHFQLINLKTKNYFQNINDQENLDKALREFQPDIVFHLAAQPLVRLSYDDPITTYDTNVTGSLKVYLSALKHNVSALVSITTDKVYENKEWLWGYRENDTLGGHDPYSASKACMELMTTSFKKSFLKDHQMLLATTRAGNVIGGGDWAKDRLIPDLARNAYENKTTMIRSPHSVRPWQHVLEPLYGYLLLGTKLLKQETLFADSFNFGPPLTQNYTVQEVCEKASKVWDKVHYQIENVDIKEKKHEAGLLKLDIEKANQVLNWSPILSGDESIKMSLEWYKEYYQNGTVQSLTHLKSFISKLQHA